VPPGQSFGRCFEEALYLLAVNGNPSEINAATVPVEAFADFLKVSGWRVAGPESRLTRGACIFKKTALQKPPQVP